MGEAIAVISGKGGTGKTTVCAAVAACLAACGKRVLCIDADVGLRNLDIALGMADLSVASFTDVMSGRAALRDAAVHPVLEQLFLLTAPVRESESRIDVASFADLLKQAKREFDFCLIDAPAGLGAGFRLATCCADRCLMVTTPDLASMRDAAHTADLLQLDGKRGLYLVVNRVRPRMFRRLEMTVDDIMDEIGLPLLGVIPEDPDVLLAAAEGNALIFATDGGAAEACLRISRRLCGDMLPLMKL